MSEHSEAERIELLIRAFREMDFIERKTDVLEILVEEAIEKDEELKARFAHVSGNIGLTDIQVTLINRLIDHMKKGELTKQWLESLPAYDSSELWNVLTQDALEVLSAEVSARDYFALLRHIEEISLD